LACELVGAGVAGVAALLELAIMAGELLLGVESEDLLHPEKATVKRRNANENFCAMIVFLVALCCMNSFTPSIYSKDDMFAA
jgi:hypothetical protein